MLNKAILAEWENLLSEFENTIYTIILWNWLKLTGNISEVADDYQRYC